MPRQPAAVNLTIFACVVSVFCSVAQSAPVSGRAARKPSTVAADVIELTNIERTHHRRLTLRANERLMQAAQLQADQMARAAHMAHELPEARYPRAQDRLAAADYRWRAFGENVAFGQPSAARVLDSWMHSPGHRLNILNPAFTEMGVGYAVDRAGRPYYVQVFAQPLP